MKRVGERVAEALVAAGLEHLFGTLASSTMRIVDHFVKALGRQYLNARHEAVALGMADGYARSSGRVGCCAVTQGPGLMNALTPLVTAQRGRSPVVLLSSDSMSMDPVRYPFSAVVQGFDQRAMLDAVGVSWVRLNERSVEAGIGGAVDRALRERRPVVVLMPAELQHAPSTAPAEPWEPPEARPRVVPQDAAVQEAAELLAEAERPVVLAGIGAVEAGARPALVALAAHAGALLATTLRATGWFSGEAYDAGICGGFSTAAAVALLKEADCVVAFGASLNYLTTRKASLFGGARIVHVDVSPAAFGRYTGADVEIVGDADATARLLLGALRARRSARIGFRTEETARALREAGADPSVSDNSHAEGGDGAVRGERIDPRALCRRVDALLPPARTVVTDSGYSFLFPVEFLTIDGPEALLFMADFGAVGCGLGPAMGAAIGRPERPSVLFVGDGGLMMTLGDLDTAARYQVPVLIVCMNDEAYGAEILQAREHGLSEVLPAYPTGSLAEVARSLGVDGRTVTSLDDLEDLPQLVAGLRGPYVLDCRTATVRSRVHEWV